MKNVVILDTCEYEQLQKDLAKANETKLNLERALLQRGHEISKLKSENNELRTRHAAALSVKDERNALREEVYMLNAISEGRRETISQIWEAAGLTGPVNVEDLLEQVNLMKISWDVRLNLERENSRLKSILGKELSNSVPD